MTEISAVPAYNPIIDMAFFPRGAFMFFDVDSVRFLLYVCEAKRSVALCLLR